MKLLRSIGWFLFNAVVIIAAFALFALFIHWMDSDSTSSAPVQAAPAYDPSCVFESSTMGCIDETTYDEAIQAKQEREDAYSSDNDYGVGRTGGYR